VNFAYDTRKEVLHDVSFRSEPGNGHGTRWSFGSRKIHDYRADRGVFTCLRAGVFLVDGVDLSTVKLNSYRTQLGVVLQETFLFDGTIREKCGFCQAQSHGNKKS